MLKSLHSKTPHHSEPILTTNLLLLFWMVMVGGSVIEPFSGVLLPHHPRSQIGTSLRLSCRNRHGHLTPANQKHWLLKIHNALRPGLLALSYNYHIPHTDHFKVWPLFHKVLKPADWQYALFKKKGSVKSTFFTWSGQLSPGQFDERNNHNLIDYSHESTLQKQVFVFLTSISLQQEQSRMFTLFLWGQRLFSTI